MRGRKYCCPNGCDLPPRRKELKKSYDGTYGFDYNDYIFVLIVAV